jgi:integrase/recombinase XerD
MRVLLAVPDRSTAHGARNHALLLFLYNTGARISEALSLRLYDLQFVRPSRVRILGKGKKVRFTPIWSETADVLRSLSRGRQPEEMVFRNARGDPLSRDGAAFLLGKYVKKAAEKLPLLQAGNDFSVIRDFLGHASIATTGLYISTTSR